MIGALSQVEQIASLIRADRHEEVEVAMAGFQDMTWADWCELCRITFSHQDSPSPAQASGSRKTETDRE